MAMQPIAAPSQQPQQAQDVQGTPKAEQIQKPQFQPIEKSEGEKAISEEAINKQIQSLNELLKARSTNVLMEYDNLSSPKKVNIVDTDSGKVIRSMPPEAAVEIADKAKNYILGMMIDHKA